MPKQELSSNQLDKLYDTIDDLLLDKKFKNVNEILKNLNVKDSPANEMIGYLTITFAMRSKLPCRPTFFAKVKDELNSRGYDHTNRILQGLDRN